jgi:hypothetical protein
MRAFIVPNGCGPAPQSDNMQKGGNRDMGKGSMSKSSNKMKHSSKSSMKKDQWSLGAAPQMRPFFLIDAHKVRPSYPARPWVDGVTLVEMREARAIGTRLLCQRSFPMIIRAEEFGSKSRAAR